jgi:hypothetical protein
MEHAKKGCLTRTRNDILSDGSRIEGSHKGWNSIQRSFTSGLGMINSQGHDHVLRRNTRAAMKVDSDDEMVRFAKSGYGSHHLSLVDAFAKRWNNYVARHVIDPSRSLPKFVDIQSGEHFGLVFSNDAKNPGLIIKAEEIDDLVILSPEEAATENLNELLESLNLNHQSLATPLEATLPGPSPRFSIERLDPALLPVMQEAATSPPVVANARKRPNAGETQSAVHGPQRPAKRTRIVSSTQKICWNLVSY